MPQKPIKPSDKTVQVYVTAVSGQTVRMALPPDFVDGVNPDYFAQRLINEGVAASDLKYVTFNLTPHKTETGPRSKFPLFAGEKPPPIPLPETPNSQLPFRSEVGYPVFKSFRELRSRSRQFGMKRVDNAYVNVFLYPESSFVNTDDWSKLNSENMGLAYGLLWSQLDRQLLTPGASMKKEASVTEGMQKETSFSVSVSMGVSYGAVSAEISSTFGTKTTINEESTKKEILEWSPPDDKQYVIGTWQLAEIISVASLDGNGNVVPVRDFTVSITESTKDGEVVNALSLADGYRGDFYGAIGAMNLTDRIDMEPKGFPA